jgi:hypothetical protein
MTRIEVPKYAHEQALVDAENASRRTRLHPKGEMNELMRGQKDRRDEQTAARVQPKIAKVLGAKVLGTPPDDLAALRRQAQEDRELAASARRQAEAARRRAK